MNLKDVTAVALRLFALWLLVQVVLHIPGLVMLLASLENYQEQLISIYAYIALLGGFALVALVVVLLIWRAAKSALESCSDADLGALESQSQRFLLQLAGVFFVVTALASLPKSLSFLSSSLAFSYANWLWPMGLLFQLVIGSVLLVGSASCLRLLARLRS